MRGRVLLVALATTSVSGCMNAPMQPVSDYFKAQQAYATALNQQVAQPPLVAVAAPPLFLWDIGWIVQGSNGLGPCPLPPAQTISVNPLPPADAERTFSLSAAVPAAITNGIVAANVDAHYNDIVRLDYTDASGRIVAQADVNPALQGPVCKRSLAAASGNAPITLVKGQILAKQRYTWLQNGGGSVGGKVTAIPGADAIGFSVSGSGGPSAPLVMTEDAASPHFLILETFAPVQPAAAAVAAGARPSGRPHVPAATFAPTPTPPETVDAFRTGRLGGLVPQQRPAMGGRQ